MPQIGVGLEVAIGIANIGNGTGVEIGMGLSLLLGLGLECGLGLALGVRLKLRGEHKVNMRSKSLPLLLQFFRRQVRRKPLAKAVWGIINESANDCPTAN